MNSLMRLRTVIALLALIVITGCGSDPGFNEATDFIRKEGSAQFINLMPDSPELTVVHGLNQTRVSYAEGSGVEVRFEDKYDWRIAYSDSDGREVTITREDDQQITEATLSTFLIMGSLTQPNVQIVDLPLAEQPEDSAEVWFASNLSTTSMVDVYVTDFGTDLSNTSPLASVDSAGLTAPFTVPAGDSKQLRITVAGSATLLFDSGEIQISGQTQNLFALTDDFGPNSSSHVDVVLASPTNSSTITDISQDTVARVMNNSLSEPLTVSLGESVLNNIMSGSRSNYTTTTPGTQTVTISQNGNIILEEDGSLGAGGFHTLMIFDSPDSESGLSAVFIQDEFRTVTDRVLIQFVNGSGQTIDFYALKNDQSQENTAPLYDNVQNIAAGVIEVLSGQASFVVTSSDGSETLASTDINLAEGNSYTVVFDSSGELQILLD